MTVPSVVTLIPNTPVGLIPTGFRVYLSKLYSPAAAPVKTVSPDMLTEKRGDPETILEIAAVPLVIPDPCPRSLPSVIP